MQKVQEQLGDRLRDLGAGGARDVRESGGVVLGSVDEACAALARHVELLRGDAAGAVRLAADNATAAMR
ncbi:MAG: hypothetical protein EXQ97_01580 [Alphaproteobacteria bacterium]|nr:hypothetical protein [Alphaproteobacteria bacterium]